MSIRRTVTVEGRAYTVVDDRRLELQAFFAGQALDETSGRPPVDRVRVRAALRGLPPAVATAERRFAVTAGVGGTFAVAGVPDLAFPPPPGSTYAVDIRLTAPGYLETPLSFSVTTGVTVFPLEPPVDPGLGRPVAWLHRPAVRLRGRITTGVVPPGPPALSPNGVAGATVQIVAPAEMLGFQAPLAFAHDVPAQVRPVTLTDVAPDLDLLEDAVAGEQRLTLARRTALAVDSVIRLGGGPEREYAVVESVLGPADLSRPGAVTLRAPVASSHRRGDPSVPAPRRVTVTPTIGTPLTRPALPGDQVLFATTPALFLSGAPFLIDDAVVARREYRVARPPEDITDADGFYVIGPIGRTASITLRVTPPALPPEPDVVVPLDYNQPDNVVNVRV